MATQGGPRPPAAPAPVSGPGRLARRTDSGPTQKLRDLPDAAYGEAATYRDLQQGAGLSNTAAQPAAPSSAPARPVVAFGAATGSPSEPVTAGANAGPGVGLDSLGLIDPAQAAQQQDLQRMLVYLPALEHAANQPTASPWTRWYVRWLKSQL